MQIDYDTLIAYGGVARKFEKGSIIFWEGSMPNFFYQIIEGEVKVFSTNHDGKNLTQGIFKTGDSFGEPPLLLGKPYPSTAQATNRSIIVRITRARLLNILADEPGVTERLLYKFADRIYYKASAAQVWVNQAPEDKIYRFLCNVKAGRCESDNKLVPYTRQQIADFTGLRVETVIRTLTRMNREGKVSIVGHKLYF